MTVYSLQLNVRTDLRQDIQNASCITGLFFPIVKNRGYLREQKIFAVLKLSLSMKLDYFNLKLFD